MLLTSAGVFFLKTKDETTKIMTDLVKKLKDVNNITVKKFWCDNVVENKTFQQLVAKLQLGLVLEYTAAHKTPQQNRRVKRKSATLFERYML